MQIGRVGVWARTDGLSIGESAEFAQRIEALGYGALWIPDAFGRDPLVHAGWLLAHTRRLVVATGIVNIHLRHPIAVAGLCADWRLGAQAIVGRWRSAGPETPSGVRRSDTPPPHATPTPCRGAPSSPSAATRAARRARPRGERPSRRRARDRAGTLRSVLVS